MKSIGNKSVKSIYSFRAISVIVIHEYHFFRSMYNKTIIRFGFCDIQNNQSLGKGY